MSRSTDSRTVWRTLAAVALMVVLMAACGSDSDDIEPSASLQVTTTVQSTTTIATTIPPTTVAPAPVGGVATGGGGTAAGSDGVSGLVLAGGLVGLALLAAGGFAWRRRME